MIAVASDDVKRNVRQIYARGQTLGRNPRTFSKVVLRETYGKQNMRIIRKLTRYKHHHVNCLSTKDIMKYSGYSQSRVTVALNRLDRDYGMIVILEEAKKGSGWKIEFQPDIGKWKIGEAGKQNALEYHRNPNPKGKDAEAAEQTEAVEAEVQREQEEDEEQLLAELSDM